MIQHLFARPQATKRIARLVRLVPGNTTIGRNRNHVSTLSRSSLGSCRSLRTLAECSTLHAGASISSRSFSSTPDPPPPEDQAEPELVPIQASRMYRHIIGPKGDVRGMCNYVGEEAKGYEIVVTHHAIPVPLGGDLFQFLSNNKLPNGRTNPIPALTPEERRLFTRPYNEWAPAPFNNNDNPLDSAMNLFLFTYSGSGDMFDFDTMISGRFEGFSFIDHELHFNKVRAWGGLVPVSDRRWREKGFEQRDTGVPPKNSLKAMDHLEKTSAFMCFHVPGVLDKMRRSYNSAYNHLAQFDRILSAHYARQPAHLQPNHANRGKAADLWSEFIFSRIQFMTARAHTWYTNHINKLHANTIDEIENTAPATPERDMAYQKLHNIVSYRVKADMSLLIPLAGFNNNLPHWRHLSSPPIINWNNHTTSGSVPLPGTFPYRIFQREKVYCTRHAHLLAEKFTGKPHNFMYSNSHLTTLPDRLSWQALHQARDELRGSAPIPITEELWITLLRAKLSLTPYPSSQEVQPTEWGFLAYRLDYTSHTPDQWLTFQDLFKSDVTNWGSGVAGHEHIKSKCKITWLDGRDFNIPENDIPAARRHFKSLRDTKSPILAGLLTPDAFLVADKHSVNSFLHPATSPDPEYLDAADLTPFITLSQSKEFDAADAALDKESPGYPGQVYVAGSVLFDDVWPALFMRLYEVKALWPNAAVHPGAVYVGPYADYQVGLWGVLNGYGREVMTGEVDPRRVEVMNEFRNARGR